MNFQTGGKSGFQNPLPIRYASQLLGWYCISSLRSADESQQGRNSCPLLRSCFMLLPCRLVSRNVFHVVSALQLKIKTDTITIQYHPTSGIMQILHFDWLRYQGTISNSNRVAKFAGFSFVFFSQINHNFFNLHGKNHKAGSQQWTAVSHQQATKIL